MLNKRIREFDCRLDSKKGYLDFITFKNTHKFPTPLCASVLCMFVATFSLLTSVEAMADAPNVQTPSPVIYLSDNLNEPDNLGWCIDTRGRGFKENLHAHSCKPRGGDVQFSFNSDDQSISSVVFTDKCMERNTIGSENDPMVTFSLFDCDASVAAQRFQFDPSNGFLSPSNELNLCVAVGDSIRQAGPFSSRDLLLLDCKTTAAVQTTWTIKD